VTTLLSVLSSILVGLILVVVPWTTLWDGNGLLQGYPFLRTFVLSTFTRGAITGLGLLNILLAFFEVRDHLSRSGEGA
jgi:hypothetical protein